MSSPQDQNPRRTPAPGRRPQYPPQHPQYPQQPAQPGRRPPPSRQVSGAQARKPEQPAREQKKPRSQNRWMRAIVMVLGTIAGCIFLAFFILQSASDLFGLNQRDEILTATIPKNTTIGEVARILAEKGIIDQPLTFRVYIGMKARDDELLPGDYVFNSNMGYDEILLALRRGNTVKEEVRLLFQEGRTLWEIAALLEEKKVCKANDFIEYLATADYSYEFFGAIDYDPLRFRKLEGYIFPDTYDFYIGENVDSVARKFLRNFNDKMTPELLARMQDLNLTIDQTITLASIIQKEAGDPDDMKLVSSVFHNRMDSGGAYPKLQSDVTIFYVEDEIKPRLRLQNQAMYDAYNTYVRDGLPVGPICNPGMDAIMAALYPEDTDFFFFVTDINGDFYYAETAQAHYKNVATAESVGGAAHGVDTQ